MPQCPNCKTPYEIGQRYCQNCESYLLEPEKGDHFCPQCGIRVAATQEICHKCNASLTPQAPGVRGETKKPEAVAASGAEPSPAVVPPRSLPLWVPATLIAAGFVIVILLAVIFTRSGPKAPPVPESPAVATSPGAPSPAAVPAPPAQPAAATPQPAEKPAVVPADTSPPRSREEILLEEVQKTFDNLKKAQMEQDIILFMSCYSYLYPSLDRKRKETLSYWNNFRYMSLEFAVDDLKPLGPDTLLAKITANLQVQNLRTHEFRNFTQKFEVSMGKELGAWRIRSLKDISEEEE